jgi:beta-galactosidase
VKKDVFYFYKANWSRTPTLHLVGRRYIDRAYGVVDVKAYSNAKEARLSLNGREIGTAACNGGICIWPNVKLVSGFNQFAATAEPNLTDAVQWIYSGSPSAVRIKAGDLSGYVAADGTRYGSDHFFTGGEGYGIKAGLPPLYGSYRAGTFTYELPLPDGEYVVTARFVEPTESAARKRVFDVLANGRVMLAGVDPFALAGAKLKPVDRSFAARATGGRLRIEFRPRDGMAAVVSALEVIGREHIRRSTP